MARVWQIVSSVVASVGDRHRYSGDKRPIVIEEWYIIAAKPRYWGTWYKKIMMCTIIMCSSCFFTITNFSYEANNLYQYSFIKKGFWENSLQHKHLISVTSILYPFQWVRLTYCRPSTACFVLLKRFHQIEISLMQIFWKRNHNSEVIISITHSKNTS